LAARQIEIDVLQIVHIDATKFDLSRHAISPSVLPAPVTTNASRSLSARRKTA
jgi:hypothetical protein